MTRSSLLAFTAFALAFAPAAWAANTISAIVPEADRVVLTGGKAIVKFMVSGQIDDGSECGIRVNYGDQDSPDTRIIGRREGAFPREFIHTFSKAGQFAVSAKGERVKQTFGCGGEASTTINIVEPERGRRRANLPACPDGWALQDGSFRRETGAFSCTPSYPAQRMECGPGLRYFERDGLIGCRPRGNSGR